MRGDQVCGDGMATRDGYATEGDLPGERSVFMLHVEPKSRPGRSQRVHTSEDAPVMGVEQRDPGRWRAERPCIRKRDLRQCLRLRKQETSVPGGRGPNRVCGRIAC